MYTICLVQLHLSKKGRVEATAMVPTRASRSFDRDAKNAGHFLHSRHDPSAAAPHLPHLKRLATLD